MGLGIRQKLRVYLVLHYDFLQVPNYRVQESQLVDAVQLRGELGTAVRHLLSSVYGVADGVVHVEENPWPARAARFAEPADGLRAEV